LYSYFIKNVEDAKKKSKCQKVKMNRSYIKKILFVFFITVAAVTTITSPE